MRTINSIKNLLVSWVGQVVVTICKFISRAVFVRFLSVEYLGVNGLFSNILLLLSFADLGIGLSAAHYLYKPLAEDDKSTITSIVQFYNKIFKLIGMIVMVIALALLPFLDSVIGENSIAYVKVIFLMHVTNSCISYFNSHKKTLITADQKLYVLQFYESLIKIIQTVVGIVFIITFKNYIVFYSLELISTLAINIAVSIKADKLYPFINDKTMLRDIREEKKKITSGIASLMVHKMSYVVLAGTDNILITKFENLTAVGYYSNYTTITNSVSSFVGKIFSSMNASIGNFTVAEAKERKKALLYNITFLQAWIYSFCSIALFVLLNPFIDIWLGEGYTLSISIVSVVVANYYIQGMRNVILAFRDAEGLFKQDQYKAIIEMVLNLGISIVLGLKYGIFGVLFGTTISMILTVVWMEPFIVIKYGIKDGNKGHLEYAVKYIVYLAEFAIGLALTYLSSTLFEGGILGFMWKLACCAIIPNAVYLCLNFKTREFKWLIEKGKETLKKVRQ